MDLLDLLGFYRTLVFYLCTVTTTYQKLRSGYPIARLIRFLSPFYLGPRRPAADVLAGLGNGREGRGEIARGRGEQRGATGVSDLVRAPEKTHWVLFELKASARLPKEQTVSDPAEVSSLLTIYSYHPPEIKHFLSESSDKVAALRIRTTRCCAFFFLLAWSVRPLKEGVATLGRRAKPKREGRKEGKFVLHAKRLNRCSEPMARGVDIEARGFEWGLASALVL